MLGKAYWIGLVLLFAYIETYAQNSASLNRTDFLIDKLNKESCQTRHYAPMYMSDEAQQLVKIKDSDKLKKLLNRITDPDKTVAINCILTKITGKEDSECYPLNHGMKPIDLKDKMSIDSLNAYLSSDSLITPSAEYINCTYNFWKNIVSK
ncbi:MAG: hypothetical protein ABIN95_02270 [Mucilaginibacter sp.]